MVVAIVAVLAAILLPVFARSLEKSMQVSCASNLRQVVMALSLYMDDHNDRMPDRRDLKLTLQGGYRPWDSWPASDPRGGWSIVVLGPYVRNQGIWSCPSVAGSRMRDLPQVSQPVDDAVCRYWFWRFDRPDEPVPLDNFWGKTTAMLIADLNESGNRHVGHADSPSDVEIVVDPYFPSTIDSVEPENRGLAVHSGGRNRGFLDGRVRWMRDIRTN